MSDGSSVDDGSEGNLSRSNSCLDGNKCFVLNGKNFNFENSVPLVLSAARQLGMATSRDAHLLWIADEALLDEYEEEEAAALTSVPLRPLSDDVAEHYGDIFAQRAKVVYVMPSASDEACDESSAPAGTPAAAPAPSAARVVESLSRTRKQSRRQHRKELRRKRLDLRDSRLSGITERYTDEIAMLDELELERQIGPRSPHSPQPAVWPADLPPTLHGELLMGRSMGSLPRIMSASAGLDQMGDHAGSDPSGSLPGSTHNSPAVERRAATSEAEGEGAGQGAAAAAAACSPMQAGGEQCDMAGSLFSIGDRVEVDFDDEGWFHGAVSSREVKALRGGSQRYVYCVRLDVGEYADSVMGSEIRPEGAADAADDGREACDGDSGEQQYANTRSDALSGFDVLSEEESDLPAEEPPHATAQMHVRVTDSGAEWSFINEDSLTWCPPTADGLKAHEAQFPRWMDVKTGFIGRE